MTTPDQGTITCYILNGTATSAGNGPGVAVGLPADEALWLIGQGLAVRGTAAPLGMDSFGPVSPP